MKLHIRSRAGACRFCGCSHFDPCAEGCAWIDSTQTLCSSAECVRGDAALLAAWITHDRITQRGVNQSGGWHVPSAAFVSFRRGFLVGFYALKKRNPYKVPAPFSKRKADPYIRNWDCGELAGRDARKRFVAQLGQPLNAPRVELVEPPKRGRRAA